jgi:hypothetical protein
MGKRSLVGGWISSMKSTWEIWLDTPEGARIALLDKTGGFTVTKTANAAGYFSLVLPPDFDRSLIRQDSIIEFWRAPEGGAMSIVLAGFVRGLAMAGTPPIVTVTGYDGNYLLGSRVVAYAAGTAQAEMTDNADDIIKELVRDNLGSDATDTDRDLSDYITVAGNVGAGVSITRAFSRRNVLTVCQELADASREGGTEIYFEMVPVISSGNLRWRMETYSGQIGRDRRQSSGTPVMIGVEYGNLDNPQYSEDYGNEKTVVYAAGQGEEASRTVVDVEDTSRSKRSVYNRREAVEDARNETDTNGLTAKGNAALEAGRPVIRFGGDLRDNDNYRFGRDWNYGDRVTCTYDGQQYDGMIRSMTISVDGSGTETISARVEVEQ